MDTGIVPYRTEVPLHGVRQLSGGVSKLILFLLSLPQTSKNLIPFHVYPCLNRMKTLGEGVHHPQGGGVGLHVHPRVIIFIPL